eukprot:655844-Pelagomonas_calceolata.AAC.1
MSCLLGAEWSEGSSFLLHCWGPCASQADRAPTSFLTLCTVQGEGEVKILGRLARHWYAHGEKDTHGESTSTLPLHHESRPNYSGDAVLRPLPLLLASLALSWLLLQG